MPVTLDHIDHLVLEGDEEVHHGNELVALSHLKLGLNFLYSQVSKVESVVLARLDPSKEVWALGNAPFLDGIPQGLIVCSFHWYAVSACNYVHLVGWLTNGHDKPKAREYVEHVAPSMYLFRNKIGAHFALSSPSPKDSQADLERSTMFGVSWYRDRFYAGAYNLSVRRKGQSSSSRTDMRWSLTEMHELLRARFGEEAKPAGEEA